MIVYALLTAGLSSSMERPTGNADAQSSIPIAAGVGGGVAVLLLVIIVILVLLVIAVKRKKQSAGSYKGQ